MDYGFYDYLNNAYWLHVQYDIEKRFNVYKSSYDAKVIFIWKKDDMVNISDGYFFVDEFKKTVANNIKYATDYEIPSCLYQTRNIEESHDILNALSMYDYEEKMKRLMSIINKEKSLSLTNKNDIIM